MSGQGHFASTLRQGRPLLGGISEPQWPLKWEPTGVGGFLGVNGGFRGEAGKREQDGLAGDRVGGGRNLKAGPGGLGSGSCPELNKQVLFWGKKKSSSMGCISHSIRSAISKSSSVAFGTFLVS